MLYFVSSEIKAMVEKIMYVFNNKILTKNTKYRECVKNLMNVNTCVPMNTGKT